MSENGLLLEEEAYEQRLCGQQFMHIPAANDGDCLFQSVFISKTALEMLKAARTALGKPGLTEAQLRARLARLAPDFLASGAMDMRIQAMDTIRASPEVFRPLVVESFMTAASGTGGDATTRLLCEQLQTRYGHELAMDEAGKVVVTEEMAGLLRAKHDLLDAYTSIMGNPGVYGEKIEILALGKALKRNIHLYYFHGERVDGKGLHQAAETFIQRGSGREISLLHSVAGRHYSALVRRDWLRKEKEVKPTNQGPLDWEYKLPEGMAACGIGLRLKPSSSATHEHFPPATRAKNGSTIGSGDSSGSQQAQVHADWGEGGRGGGDVVEIVEVHKSSGAAKELIAKGDLLLMVDGLPVRWVRACKGGIGREVRQSRCRCAWKVGRGGRFVLLWLLAVRLPRAPMVVVGCCMLGKLVLLPVLCSTFHRP